MGLCFLLGSQISKETKNKIYRLKGSQNTNNSEKQSTVLIHQQCFPTHSWTHLLSPESNEIAESRLKLLRAVPVQGLDDVGCRNQTANVKSLYYSGYGNLFFFFSPTHDTILPGGEKEEVKMNHHKCRTKLNDSEPSTYAV